jgi:hypothetical protein
MGGGFVQCLTRRSITHSSCLIHTTRQPVVAQCERLERASLEQRLRTGGTSSKGSAVKVNTAASKSRGVRRRLTLTVAACALLPALVAISTTSAIASTRNANLDGKWTLSSGYLVVSGENVTTGTFGGFVKSDKASSSIPIATGLVVGDSFSFTSEIAGTVVDVNGAQFDYAGTVNGNTMSIKETGLRVWHKGHRVSAVDDDPGPYTATRPGVDLSGTIEIGCSPNAGSCPAGSGPLYDADVDVEGPTTASTTTDTDGKWTVSVAPGHYTITPSASGVTFSPDSLDVDVTKATDGQDFTSCAADSSGSSLRAPLVRNAASSSTWTLTGKYCYNTYSVTYSTATKDATVTWIAKKYICDRTTRFFYNARLGKTLFSNAYVGSRSAPGTVSILAGNSVQVNVNDGGNLVLEFTIAPDGATGVVSTYPSNYAVSLVTGGDSHTCQPVGANHSKLPFTVSN